MLQIPTLLLSNFRAHLVEKGISPDRFQEYKKWLHYFLDVCEKYQVESENALKLRQFINKLKEKNQLFDQRGLAYHAVSMYFDMLNLEQGTLADSISATDLQPMPRCQTSMEVSKTEPNILRKAQYSEAGYQEKSDSLEWDKVLEAMATEIKVRHYSRKTLQTYAKWSRNFQRFLKNKPPEALTKFDVNILTIHGKGKKDRTVPLPESILPELKAQMIAVGELHDKDLAAGYDGVFLDDAVETKYPKAPKEFIHQWFFPMKTLTAAENGER